MKKGLVTIGIALYNNQNYIERCVNSAIGQTYDNIEILIVDDGSTDNSLAVVSMIKDDRITIIRQSNNGLSSVRQKCLEMAKGEYICFIDGDDYLESDYVQKLYSAIITKNADIAICGTVFTSETGDVLKEATDDYSFDTSEYIKINKINLKNEYCSLLNTYYMSDSWNKIYRMTFLVSNELEFECPKGYNGTDLIFNHKILLHEPSIAVIEDRLYIHVLYKKSATHRKKKNLWKSMIVATDQIICESKKLNIYLLMENQISNIFYLLIRNAIQDLYTETNGNKSEFYASLLEINTSLEKYVWGNNRLRIKKAISTSLNIFYYILLFKWKRLMYIYCTIQSRREKVL